MDVTHLLLVVDGATLQAVPLPVSGVVTIGRSKTCWVSVDASSVSRHHATLVIGADIRLEDTGSANGTFVGGVRIATRTPVTLELGLPFRVGGATLVIKPRALHTAHGLRASSNADL
jgi:pSer/pThr/pTyr-binding forkhead associated (FHA) protein